MQYHACYLIIIIFWYFIPRQGSIIVDFVVAALQNFTTASVVLKTIIDTNPIGPYRVQSSTVTG